MWSTQLTCVCVVYCPASARRAAHWTPAVARASAEVLRRRRTACQVRDQPCANTLPRLSSNWACIATLRRRAVPAQYRITPKLSPTIRADRWFVLTSSSKDSAVRQPMASATWAPASQGIATCACAMHLGGPPCTSCCHSVAPAPATRDPRMSRAPPSKVASKGHRASSHAGEGQLVATISEQLRICAVATSRAT